MDDLDVMKFWVIYTIHSRHRPQKTVSFNPVPLIHSQTLTNFLGFRFTNHCFLAIRLKD